MRVLIGMLRRCRRWVCDPWHLLILIGLLWQLHMGLWHRGVIAMPFMLWASPVAAQSTFTSEEGVVSNTPERPPLWREGFEAGVRYGLLAKATNPKEDSITALTKIALDYYWQVTKWK